MLVAYDVALDLICVLRSVVAQLRKHSRDAADQVERAAKDAAALPPSGSKTRFSRRAG
jgi:hypothetical protein